MTLSFAQRHIGPREKDIKEMLSALKVDSMEELVKQTVPENILLKKDLEMDAPMTENQYLARLKEMVGKNKNFRSLIGQGYYGTGVLPVIVRNIFENPCWYTSYTPYQAEISQGRLEALLIFQTVISSLTGFPLSNCSMLDDAQAAGEAMRMMHEVRSREAVKAGKDVVFVDEEIFPQVLSVLKTRAAGLGITIETGNYKKYEFGPKCYGARVQYAAASGEIRDESSYVEAARGSGSLVR